MKRAAVGISGRALAAVGVVAAGVAVIVVACGTTPLKGDTGIRPFSFDLWDVHCPSGLRVIFERAPGSQTAAVTTVVGAGSVEDPPGREGLAHLAEHLTFRSRGPGEAALWPRLWALGVSYNAYTDFDATTYSDLMPSVRLPEVLAAEGRRLLDPLEGVDEATFAVERDIVRNELRERNETHAFGAAYAAAFEAAFPAGHPYRRAVGGTHDSISNLTLDDARRYVRAYYRPDNMTMVVVGDMELTAVDEFVRKLLPPGLYGDPAHARPLATPPAPLANPPAPPPDRTLRRAHESVTTPELWISWPLPGGYGRERWMAQMWSSLTDDNFYRGRFNDDDIGRLEFFVRPGLQGSLLICRVLLTTGDHPEQSLREVVTNLPWIGGDELHLDARVRRLKAGLLREIAFGSESVMNRSAERATYAQRVGSASAYGTIIDQVKSITADQAQAFAEWYLSADRARAVFVEPLGADAPPPQPIPAAQDLATIVDRTALTAGTLRELALVRHLDGLKRTKLDNGLEIVALPRPGASVITATLAFHVDRTTVGTGLAEAAQEAYKLRFEESAGDFGIAYFVTVRPDLLTFTARAGATNLPRALEMLSFGTRSLDVDWPSDKFREVKAPLRRRYEASPQGRADRAVWQALFRGHPFAAKPTTDQVGAQKASEIQNWLDGVVRPANGVLVVVGDMGADEATAAARDALARLGGAPGVVAAPSPARPPTTGGGLGALEGEPGAIVTHRPGASQAELELRCLLPPADARGDAANDLTAELIGKWLQDDLRQRWGSTYGVHASAWTLRGGTATLTINAAIDNGQLATALRVLRGLWRSWTTDGIPADTVQSARDRVTISRLLRYDTSPALGRALVELWNQGWDVSTIDEAPRQFASVEASEVQATLRACADNMVVGLTGDEKVIRAALATRGALPPEPPSPAPRAPGDEPMTP